jgi:hypothetical protein
VAQYSLDRELSFVPAEGLFGAELMGAQPSEVGAYPNLFWLIVTLLLHQILVVLAHLNRFSHAVRLRPSASDLVEN